MARILRMEYIGSAENRLLVFVALVGLPMVSGFVLLGMSVALLDANSTNPAAGSQIAIRAAGYLPIGCLGYFVIAGLVIAVIAIIFRVLSLFNLLPLPDELPAGSRKDYHSLLYAVKDKLYYLPGGAGYRKYREQRLRRKALQGERES